MLAASAGEAANSSTGALSASQKAQVQAQLRALFDKKDENKDGFLDKFELAHAFRGAKAKPPEQGMYDDKGRFTQVYYQARTKYPEMLFLWTVDKDQDGQVNWAEYLTYGLQVAAAQQQQLLALQRGQQAATRQVARGSTRTRTVTRSRSSQPRRTYTRGHSASSPQYQLARAMQNTAQSQLNMERAYMAAMYRQAEMVQQQANAMRQRMLAAQRAEVQRAAMLRARANARRR
jgi:hypothetical protein